MIFQLTCQGHIAIKWWLEPGSEPKSLLNAQLFLVSPVSCVYHLLSKAGLLSLVLSLFERLGALSNFVGEGNGNPLQYSCLENPMDRGAWWTTVHGVAESRTRLSDFTFTFCITGPKDGMGPTWLNRLQEFPSCLPSGDNGFVTHSEEREKKNTNLKKQDKIFKKGPPCLHPFMPPFWWYSSSPVLP